MELFHIGSWVVQLVVSLLRLILFSISPWTSLLILGAPLRGPGYRSWKEVASWPWALRERERERERDRETERKTEREVTLPPSFLFCFLQCHPQNYVSLSDFTFQSKRLWRWKERCLFICYGELFPHTMEEASTERHPSNGILWGNLQFLTGLPCPLFLSSLRKHFFSLKVNHMTFNPPFWKPTRSPYFLSWVPIGVRCCV